MYESGGKKGLSDFMWGCTKRIERLSSTVCDLNPQPPLPHLQRVSHWASSAIQAASIPHSDAVGARHLCEMLIRFENGRIACTGRAFRLCVLIFALHRAA